MGVKILVTPVSCAREILYVLYAMKYKYKFNKSREQITVDDITHECDNNWAEVTSTFSGTVSLRCIKFSSSPQ